MTDRMDCQSVVTTPAKTCTDEVQVYDGLVLLCLLQFPYSGPSSPSMVVQGESDVRPDTIRHNRFHHADRGDLLHDGRATRASGRSEAVLGGTGYQGEIIIHANHMSQR